MALVDMAIPIAGPSRQYIQPLAFDLDLDCPSTLSHKPISGSQWPFDSCGPLTRIGEEEPEAFVLRRYLETLLLPEVSLRRSDLP